MFVICGNGELRQVLEASARDLSNVRFIDLQPAEQLNALLNMADIHLLPQLRGAADLVMPSKLAAMLASGRPVIAGAVRGTEIATVVEDCGVLTEPECALGFANAILELAGDEDRRAAMGRAGRDYAERTLSTPAVFDRLHLQIALVRPATRQAARAVAVQR